MVLVSVHADAHHRVADLITLCAHLGEDAGKFAPVEKQVVGPAEVGMQAGEWRNRRLHRQPGGEGERQRVLSAERGPQHDRYMDAERGLREPLMIATPT